MKQSDDNMTIYTQLMKLVFLSKHQMYSLGEEYDLTVMQSGAVMMLSDGEPKPMRVLSNYFMCDASTVTGLVDRLEARGIITRQNHPTDRRIKLIALTKAGIALQKKIQSKVAAIESDRIGSVLNAQERATLHDLLERILQEQSK